MNRTADFAVELIMSGLGKRISMKTRVAVIYGGRSGEHEVSVRSAKAILAGLDPEKYETIEYFIDKQGKWSPQPILPEPGAHPGIDVVFPVLHGTFGEDGTMQGLLELADLPYVGAGVHGVGRLHGQGDDEACL